MSIKKRSITLLHGNFPESFFDTLTGLNGGVFALEGRPLLTSAQRVVDQLNARQMTPTIISDNMAGFLFSKDLVKEVYLACTDTDRKGAMCLIGGLILAVLGKRHKVPVKIIKTEKKEYLMGDPQDLFAIKGVKVVPAGSKGYVPLAEWVPRKYITRISH